MRRIMLILVSLTAAVACGKQPTGLEVCHKLEAAGVAAGCKTEQASGLGAAAAEKAAFDLPSVPGKTGQVLRFEKDEQYEATVNAFSGAAVLAGPHRYGSPKTRIFVQLNDKASGEVGARAKAVVDALPGDSSGPPVSTSPPPEAKAAPSASAAVSATAAPPVVVTSAADVCHKLEAAGVAKSCGKKPSADPNNVLFDIASMPGKSGTVVHVTDDKAFTKYAALVDSSPPTSALRPFSTSPKAHVVVHLTKGVSPDVESKTKAVLDTL